MIALRQLFKKYNGFLRGFKLVYIINNLLNSNKLKHNKNLYEKYGLQKSIFSSLGSHDFKKVSQDIPWLDRPDAKQLLVQHPDYKTFSTKTQEQIVNFIEKGYMVLKGFHKEEDIENLNRDIEKLLEKNKTDFNYTGKKIMDAFQLSETANQHFFKHPELIKLLNFVMGKKVVPFQTINFIEGSEQRAHSDFIHMTSEPRGYLVAAWTALEDCHRGNGPLFFYPGSHRLPYILCEDYDSGNTKWKIGDNSYKKYEDRIEDLIREKQLQKQYFLGNKGDVFIWHANLLHGGSPITQKGATRKSMVAHYFCEDVICYHEISQRPALIDSKR